MFEVIKLPSYLVIKLCLPLTKKFDHPIAFSFRLYAFSSPALLIVFILKTTPKMFC